MTALEALRVLGPIDVYALARRVGTDVAGAELRLRMLARDGRVADVGHLEDREHLYELTGRGRRYFDFKAPRLRARRRRLARGTCPAGAA